MAKALTALYFLVYQWYYWWCERDYSLAPTRLCKRALNLDNIPMQQTIELMKNKNQLQQKVVEFIKNADLYMDNFEYVDMD